MLLIIFSSSTLGLKEALGVFDANFNSSTQEAATTTSKSPDAVQLSHISFVTFVLSRPVPGP